MTGKDCIHYNVCQDEHKDKLKCSEFKNKADFVEVVRCEKCKYFIPDAELDHDKYPNDLCADGFCDNALRYANKLEFCSSGERRTDNDM